MHSFNVFIARCAALIGGAVLMCLILLTCISVLGRYLNSAFHGWLGEYLPTFSEWALRMGVGPINGDFEIVEAGSAFVIFAFLPLCQLNSGHAVVDIFTAKLSPSINRFLAMVIELIFACVIVLITVQLYGGMVSKFGYGENTFILQFPVWWGYAASFVAAAVTTFVAFYMAFVRCRSWYQGREIEG